MTALKTDEKSLSVPLLDLGAQYREIESEIGAAVDRVLRAQRFILGPEVEGLEAEVAAYCQCAYGIGVSSGTDALLVALMAINLGGMSPCFANGGEYSEANIRVWATQF